MNRYTYVDHGANGLNKTVVFVYLSNDVSHADAAYNSRFTMGDKRVDVSRQPWVGCSIEFSVKLESHLPDTLQIDVAW